MQLLLALFIAGRYSVLRHNGGLLATSTLRLKLVIFQLGPYPYSIYRHDSYRYHYNLYEQSKNASRLRYWVDSILIRQEWRSRRSPCQRCLMAQKTAYVRAKIC